MIETTARDEKAILSGQKPSMRSSTITSGSDDLTMDHLVAVKKLRNFYIVALVVPTLISMWYISAMFFPKDVQQNFSFFLWSTGVLERDDDGTPRICPYKAVCAEGVGQIFLIGISRLSAFASYAAMALTFVSKMHSLIHYLSTTYMSTLVPFESLHDVHHLTGKMFGWSALLHTVAHHLRYIVRGNVDKQFGTAIYISGLIAILAMGCTTLSMSSLLKKRFAFEKRFNVHWMFFVLVVALCFHKERTRVIVLIFFGLWLLDYIYGIFRRTHRLTHVEFSHVADDAGTQMLWRNPKGFNPKSGEYVQVKLPWLEDGGNQWHPFSIYLREATRAGLDTVYQNGGDYAISSDKVEDKKDFHNFVDEVLQASENINLKARAIKDPSKLALNIARENHLEKYKTTQIFISPVGNWSKGLLSQVQGRKELRSCWVRGPFLSPYFVVHDYNHLVLTASGIGITPTLGVMGQFVGHSRTKIVVWSTRSKTMLQFFAPLLTDAHLAVVFYTNKKDPLTAQEEAKILSHGNIFIQSSRPESLKDTIASIITTFENELNELGSSVSTLSKVDPKHRAAWCVLYCGGSEAMKNELHTFTKEKGLGWECEVFDW